MSIHMIGIDYNRADLDVRALFSLTKKGAVAAMEKICQLPGVSGCVILSTCNRTEIWVNTDERAQNAMADQLYRTICELKNIKEDFFEMFVYKEGGAAVEHLFWLTSGMKSRIFGEDQILTQVKEALALAHENNFSDSVLEVLFRLAVTAAKQVKTQVIFPHGNVSAISHAVKALSDKGCQIEKSRCMVIGNGQMGILAARAFRDAGAQVWMTVRAYRHGQAEVPEGCEKIPFEERAGYIGACDYIISATASPHYVMTRELFEKNEYKNELIIVDLSVPRDVEESIGELDGIHLFNIDDFESDIRDEDTEKAIQKAEVILAEYMEDFYQWLDGKDVVPRIQMLKEVIAGDLLMRMQRPVRKSGLSENDQERLLRDIEAAAQKTANKLLFGLKSYLTQEEFRRCVEGMEKLYGEEA